MTSSVVVKVKDIINGKSNRYPCIADIDNKKQVPAVFMTVFMTIQDSPPKKGIFQIPASKTLISGLFLDFLFKITGFFELKIEFPPK